MTLGPLMIDVQGTSLTEEDRELVQHPLVGAVILFTRNFESREQVTALIDDLRAERPDPFLVCVDQEGGPVQRFKAGFTRLPALARIGELCARDAKAGVDVAETHAWLMASEMRAIGVDLSFAPVADLARGNRAIGERAFSPDPETVSTLIQAYLRGMRLAGMAATLKHFPGLGRVQRDTHLVSADLDTPVDELEASDWRPFREILATSKAELMIGHVNLTKVDPDRPASHSKAVIDGIIRKKWNYQGVIITDDLVMGAIYGGDVCQAVVEALNGGADLLLVAYDGAQFYRVFGCAAQALARGELDMAMLRASEARLQRWSGE